MCEIKYDKNTTPAGHQTRKIPLNAVELMVRAQVLETFDLSLVHLLGKQVGWLIS